jgi:hypothetical protein
MQMNRTVKRVAAVAALGATMGVVAPVASASAATPFPVPGLPAGGFGGFDPSTFAPSSDFAQFPLGLGGEGVGAATVVGPVIITTGAGISFINTNNQVTAGSALSGGQVTVP